MRNQFKRGILSLISTLIFILALSVGIAAAVGPEIGLAFGAVSTVAALAIPSPVNVLGMNNTNNFTARESYRIAKELFYNGFRNLFPQGKQGDEDCRAFVNSRKLSQSEVRLECSLSATQTVFNFGLTPNQRNNDGIIFNTENRLTMQDSLVASEYGVFVGNTAGTTDTAWELKTYGSQPTFAAASADAINQTFFSHGSFRITANNDVVMPYRGLFNNWYRGQTQQTNVFGVGSPADQIRGAEDGFITMEPNILLIGSKGYLPQIIVPVNLASVDADSRIVLIFRGVLAQNSTSVS